MENFKLNLDRPEISSNEIEKNQNFDNILSSYKKMKPPVYKNPWFWGSAGLATVGLTTIVSLNAMSNKNETNDKNITLNSKNLPQDTECIKTPLEKEDIKFTTFVVNPSKNEKISLESGTTIEIPKGALIAENKQENVEIKVREFRDKSSAFVAGIPMDLSKNEAFESAGMIEIRGTQDNKEVKINEDKPILVDLKTTQDPSTFGFWYLNEENKKWENYPLLKEKLASEVASKSSNSVEKKIQENEKELLKLNSKIAEVKSEIALMKVPSQESYKIPNKGAQKFDLDFDKKDYPELASFKNLVFEVIPSKNLDPNFSKKTWSEMDLSKDGEKYVMKFKNSRESASVNVRPVLSGTELKVAEKNFDEALQNYKSNKQSLDTKKSSYEAKKIEHEKKLALLMQDEEQEVKQNSSRNSQSLLAKEKVKQETNNVLASSNSLSFQTTRFGVFNSDKPIAYPKSLPVEIAFLWIGSQVAKFKQVFVFNMDKNNRYSYGEGFLNPIENIGFHKNDDLVIIGIDFDGNLGYTEINDFDDTKIKDKLEFHKKGRSENTLDLLKKLLDETTSIS